MLIISISLAIPLNSTSEGGEQGEEVGGRRGRRTKVDNVKYPPLSSLRYRSEHNTILARIDPYDSFQRRPVMLHELNTGFLLFPKLQMTVHGSGDHETGSASLAPPSHTSFPAFGEAVRAKRRT